MNYGSKGWSIVILTFVITLMATIACSSEESDKLTTSTKTDSIEKTASTETAASVQEAFDLIDTNFTEAESVYKDKPITVTGQAKKVEGFGGGSDDPGNLKLAGDINVVLVLGSDVSPDSAAHCYLANSPEELSDKEKERLNNISIGEEVTVSGMVTVVSNMPAATLKIKQCIFE